MHLHLLMTAVFREVKRNIGRRALLGLDSSSKGSVMLFDKSP